MDRKEKTIDFSLTGEDIRIIYDALCARWEQYEKMYKELDNKFPSQGTNKILEDISAAQFGLEGTKIKFGDFLGCE